MKITTREKLVNVFGQDTLFKLEQQAIRKSKWIARHCNTLYITQYNKDSDSFEYFIEKKSNRLHKFKDICKLNYLKKQETNGGDPDTSNTQC